MDFIERLGVPLRVAMSGVTLSLHSFATLRNEPSGSPLPALTQKLRAQLANDNPGNHFFAFGAVSFESGFHGGIKTRMSGNKFIADY